MSESLPAVAAERAGVTAEQGAAPVAAVGRERLRELAMAATGKTPLVYGSAGGARLRHGAISQEVGAFHLAANPAAVLALLDEIDRLRADARVTMDVGAVIADLRMRLAAAERALAIAGALIEIDTTKAELVQLVAETVP